MPNDQLKWDLSPLLKGDNDTSINARRRIIKEKNYAFITKWANNKDYLEKPTILKQALDEYDALARKYLSGGVEGYYFGLRAMQNQTDPELKAKGNKIDDFTTKIANDLQFFEMRLARVPKDIQKKFLANSELKPYKHFLETLFANAKYLLSEPEEKIMNLISTPAYSNWVNMTEDFISRQEKQVSVDNKMQKKSFAEITSLMNSTNKKTRDSAAKAFNEILVDNADVAEHEINSVLKCKQINDELRNLPRPDTSRHIGDDIDTKVVDTLIKTISENFDISRRYYALKSKLMGIKKLKYHERNVPYGKIDKKYEYAEAKELVSKVLGALDNEFKQIFEMFNNNNQIDVFPRKHKRSGACCAHYLITHPTYILLNYGKRLADVTTLAHETGHGINNELIKKQQNAINFGTPTSTAEVASTFMEDFVLRELTKDADDELKLAIMAMRLNDSVSTIFRQIACYMFEQELHKAFREKGYLSKEEIGKMFQKHMAAYMGTAVEQSPGSENWWVYWSHIRAFFYNYSYASGLLISKALQNIVKKDPKRITDVKKFLAAGVSDSPKRIFKSLGIDITKANFWKRGVDELRNLLSETEKLAKKLGKIK